MTPNFNLIRELASSEHHTARLVAATISANGDSVTRRQNVTGRNGGERGTGTRPNALNMSGASATRKLGKPISSAGATSTSRGTCSKGDSATAIWSSVITENGAHVVGKLNGCSLPSTISTMTVPSIGAVSKASGRADRLSTTGWFDLGFLLGSRPSADSAIGASMSMVVSAHIKFAEGPTTRAAARTAKWLEARGASVI